MRTIIPTKTGRVRMPTPKLLTSELKRSSNPLKIHIKKAKI